MTSATTTDTSGALPRPGDAGAERLARSGRFTGTGTLLRLALRRDRVLIPVWLLAISGSFASVAGSFASLYPTVADRAGLAASTNANGSLRALYGPVLGDSAGALVSWRMGGFGAAMAAVMSLIVVVRHTREEEETGRQEMLSAAPLGRRAPLTAALLAAAVADLALATLVVLLLTSAGCGGPGAYALGLAVAGTGLLFAATAAVAAQLTGTARAAKGLTAAAIGAAYVLKAAGDAASSGGSSVLTRLSPFGWVENTRAYAGERWWVLLAFAAGTAVLLALAFALAGRRDLGSGLFATRPGPARGRITTPYGLALRLQRGSLAGWTASFAVVGLVFGRLADGAADLVGGNEQTREIIARMGGAAGLTDAFLAAMAGMLGMVAALYTVSSALRPLAEETGGLAEPVLVAGATRTAWAGGHLLFAFGGAVAVMGAGGLGLAAGYGHRLPAVLGAALVQLPAIWLLGGVAVLLYGVAPRIAAAGSWGAAGLCLALGWIGPAVDLPQAALDVSPFTHLPKLPGDDLRGWALAALTAVTAALVTAGLAALRRRDLRG
ncbi:ABC transporter permease [Streptomyces sp. NBC_00102]|uniref:ABC transporter permease n=1 Tax=Streptomyces sp. NBC_00102 TaxID=2975652 RepID=UPI0022529549|nr:ABC transporter permease [Streptomyces sp. NBC_00102]MCX5398586.1 ABC transporter permease [Streptomyces sp. NBC_00102]